MERWAAGIIVGGLPIGEIAYVHDWMRVKVKEVLELIAKTVDELHSSPHALWSCIYYSLQRTFEYVLRHLTPEVTQPWARAVDEALIAAAERCGYEGMLGDGLTRRRFRLPARMRGCGIRSLERLAPAAYCACFIESVHHMLDRPTADGRQDGYFRMLAEFMGGALQMGGRPSATVAPVSRTLWRCTDMMTHASRRWPSAMHGWR